MEKELKIGQNVRIVDFKRTRVQHWDSAYKWNWECPELLKSVVTEPKGRLEPHFIQFTWEVSKFEEKGVADSIWEYRLLVSVLTKSGKIYRGDSCTCNKVGTAEEMHNDLLGIIHTMGKSKQNFDKFMNTVWDNGNVTVFRLGKDFIDSITESVSIKSVDDFMKYLDTFVDNPRGWSEATSEIEDIARYCTQTAKEVDGLDVSHAPVREFGKRGPFKTPAEWNKGYKGYIKDIFGKMSKRAQDMVVKNTHQMFND